MVFHDLATSCVIEQAELGRSRYEPAVTLRFGCAAEFRHSRIVSTLDDIAGWAKNLATFKLAPPPVWPASPPLVGAKAAELWDRIAAAGIQDAPVRVAPYAGGVIKWFAAQVGQRRRIAAGIFIDGSAGGRHVCRWRAGNTAAFSFWP